MELTPIFRIEKFLDAIINSTTPPEPMFRVEYFLAKIGGADVVTPEPMFRIEKYLAKILGEDVEIPEPMFRTEFWLAKKCGEDVETPDPAFRVEYWLEEWCGGSAPTYETITGKIVSFLTQRIAPLKIEADLEPIQSGTGDQSPDNVRPITGHTGAVVYVKNKNIIPTSVPSNVIAGTFTSTGTQINSASNARVFAIPVPKNTDIHIQKKSGDTTGHNVSLGDSGTPTVGTQIYSATGMTNAVDVNLNTGNHSWLYVQSSTLALAEDLFTTTEFMVSLGTTRQDYVAPSGSSVTITFGSTVYGGKLTVNEDGTGSVVSEWASVTLDGTTGSSNGHTSISTRAFFDIAGKAYGVQNIRSDKFVVNGSIQDFVGKMVGRAVSNGVEFYLPVDVPNNPAGVRAWFSENPTQLVYELETPVTIPLSPGQVNALLGNNTVWVDDATSVTVTYQSN